LKRKYPPPGQFDTFNIPRRLREGLEYADHLLSKNEPLEALQVIKELHEIYPRSAELLEIMADAYLEMQNMHGYFKTMYQLHQLTPNRAVVKLGLANAYLANGRLALALQTYRQFCAKWHQDERVAEIQKTIQIIEGSLMSFFQELELSFEDDFDFACKHDELQIQLDLENYARCKQLADYLQSKKPDFVPPLNNLSLVYWMEGNLQKAVETCLKVTEIEPDNIHALSNLTRFYFMLGEKEKAGHFAQILKNSREKASDIWIKKIEALSFIEDDAGVLEVFKQAENAKELDHLNGITWNWIASAEYLTGDLSNARKHWRKGLKVSPNLSLIEENLEQLKNPAHERTCPQVFSLDMWLPKSVVSDLVSLIDQAYRKKGKQQLNSPLNKFVSNHTEIQQFMPAALSRGDETSKKMALALAELSEFSNTLEGLKTFVLGREGPDSLRMEVANILTKKGVFQSGKKIDLWIKGEARPIMLLGFEITAEAQDASNLKPKVLRLMEQAIAALRENDGATAEQYLRQAIEIQPNEPVLHNNLAVALNIQGKTDEAHAIAERMCEQFPDYYFAKIIIARKAIGKEDFEKANSILEDIMRKPLLHITEFSALCACQIDLAIARKVPEAAISWYQMWEGVDPEDPLLENYDMQIRMLEALTKLTERAPGKSKKKQRNQ
jgi:tetratricopeptide (TPR) repeat protein